MSKSSRDNRTRKLSFLGFNTREHRNVDPDQVLLDTEMDKVFGGTKASSEKFDVSALTDLNSPMKMDKERQKTKTSPFQDDRSSEQQRKNICDDRETGNANGFTVGSVDDEEDVSATHSSGKNDDSLPEETPMVSERAEFGIHSDSSSDEKHVKFTKNEAEIGSPNLGSEANDRFEERKRRKSRHQYYKQRKYSHQESVEARRLGEVALDAPRISVQPEDTTLQEADQKELISHRSDDPRALRRHKIHHMSLKHKELPQISGIAGPLHAKKNFDHSPHEVFVQLDELIGTGEEREWKETARWIKYEEHVEEGSDRWGRPHVASLSFHSLLNLRRCLETGVVLLDLEEKDLPGVSYRVVEQMVVEDLISAHDKPTVMRALLLRHRHVNDHSHSAFPFTKRKYNSYTSLQNLSDDKKPKIIPANEINGNSKKNDFKIDMKEETYSSSQEDLKKLQNDTILRRIPHGAEATTVLVGAVDFLEQPTIAFVRLAEGIPMPSITEVPIPVRFLFILLGPKTVDLDYHEVGRSIATLMSNEHFHGIAYKAEDRKELLSAINEFLDDSIVLPPGNWDRHELLPFEELKAKKDWIRNRKTKALQEKKKTGKVVVAEGSKPLLEVAASEKKPPGPLEKTHRLWGGLVNDIRRRLPMYKSDILDGLNTETLAASIFMYFAALSTAITFGGLASEKTHNLIGISETLLSASVVGLVFHAISGQPLVIIGTTGPLLLFDEALFKFCLENELSFLSVRFYVSIWLVLIGLVVSAFEGSVYVRMLTRFTQEIFSALITLIYIFETFMKLISVYTRHPLLSEYMYKTEISPGIYESNTTTGINNVSDSTELPMQLDKIELSTIASDLLDSEDQLGEINQPNTALFCTILTLGTFTVAYYLKLFRNSHFLGRNARRALGDFGVPISIAIFVAVDYFIPQVFTEKLSVPKGISSDYRSRDWLVPLWPVPIWLPFMAGVPAVLVYILIFMETHISELIVDKPERCLKKGSGLHLDIVLLCFLNVVCGLFGMPWHCAATVRSVAHVSAVTIMSRTHAPGESPRIIEVKEQRLSGLFVSLMVGLSVTMAPLLRLIPMAVLFGVFLYMGVASMSGVQFFDRLRLFFMPVKHHPPTPFVKRVPTWKMHAFTAIQIILLAILWVVKSSKISLAFPFFLIIMVPLRIQLSKLYTAPEMNALDGSQRKVEADDEPDFYEQATIPA